MPPTKAMLSSKKQKFLSKLVALSLCFQTFTPVAFAANDAYTGATVTDSFCKVVEGKLEAKDGIVVTHLKDNEGNDQTKLCIQFEKTVDAAGKVVKNTRTEKKNLLNSLYPNAKEIAPKNAHQELAETYLGGGVTNITQIINSDVQVNEGSGTEGNPTGTPSTDPVVEVKCEDGQTLTDGKCIDPTCAENEVLNNHKCEAKPTETKLVCDEGMALDSSGKHCCAADAEGKAQGNWDSTTGKCVIKEDPTPAEVKCNAGESLDKDYMKCCPMSRGEDGTLVADRVWNVDTQKCEKTGAETKDPEVKCGSGQTSFATSNGSYKCCNTGYSYNEGQNACIPNQTVEEKDDDGGNDNVQNALMGLGALAGLGGAGSLFGGHKKTDTGSHATEGFHGQQNQTGNREASQKIPFDLRFGIGKDKNNAKIVGEENLTVGNIIDDALYIAGMKNENAKGNFDWDTLYYSFSKGKLNSNEAKEYTRAQMEITKSTNDIAWNDLASELVDTTQFKQGANKIDETYYVYVLPYKNGKPIINMPYQIPLRLAATANVLDGGQINRDEEIGASGIQPVEPKQVDDYTTSMSAMSIGKGIWNSETNTCDVKLDPESAQGILETESERNEVKYDDVSDLTLSIPMTKANSEEAQQACESIGEGTALTLDKATVAGYANGKLILKNDSDSEVSISGSTGDTKYWAYRESALNAIDGGYRNIIQWYEGPNGTGDLHELYLSGEKIEALRRGEEVVLGTQNMDYFMSPSNICADGQTVAECMGVDIDGSETIVLKKNGSTGYYGLYFVDEDGNEQELENGGAWVADLQNARQVAGIKKFEDSAYFNKEDQENRGKGLQGFTTTGVYAVTAGAFSNPMSTILAGDNYSNNSALTRKQGPRKESIDNAAAKAAESYIGPSSGRSLSEGWTNEDFEEYKKLHPNNKDSEGRVLNNPSELNILRRYDEAVRNGDTAQMKQIEEEARQNEIYLSGGKYSIDEKDKGIASNSLTRKTSNASQIASQNNSATSYTGPSSGRSLAESWTTEDFEEYKKLHPNNKDSEGRILNNPSELAILRKYDQAVKSGDTAKMKQIEEEARQNEIYLSGGKYSIDEADRS